VLIDTHCHLDLADFDADRQAVIARALAAGVGTMINPSVDLEGGTAIVQLAEDSPALYAAVGVQPNHAANWDRGMLAQVKTLAQRDKVVSIGEIGLDYYWDKAPKDVQKRAFQDQLELAAEMELPVIVHNREAGDDVMTILLDWHSGLVQTASPLASRPGVLHSFSGDKEMAQKAIAASFFIGLTGPLTFKKAKDLQDLAVDLPLDRILIETDSPYLSPHPERGKRNEPAKVKLVAEKLADLKGITFDEVAAATTANAQRLFCIEGRA
jgi:TatD DNase family protein